MLSLLELVLAVGQNWMETRMMNGQWSFTSLISVQPVYRAVRVTSDFKRIERSIDGLRADFSVPCARSVPPELELTQWHIDTWADCIQSLVEIPSDFGSVKQWIMMSKFHELENADVSSFLLYDCAGGRVAVRIACATLKEYYANMSAERMSKHICRKLGMEYHG
jgi:hypothetical protein